jgi:zinc transporter
VKVRSFTLEKGRLLERQGSADCSVESLRKAGQCWLDLDAAGPDELQSFLAPFELPDSLLDRCLNKTTDPGVVATETAILMEYPVVLHPGADTPAFLTILLSGGLLVTVRRGSIPTLDDLMDRLAAGGAAQLAHLPQIIYLVLDEFADLNVASQIALRNEIQRLARTVAENPQAARADSLSGLRWRVGGLVALIEDQLYCVSGLKASDSAALADPHRAAFLEDLVSEAEIAQRGMYRLETRVNDLYRDYQVLSSDRVDRRLRVLTIVSAITLPLGLVTGLLGMNVGGIPGQSVWFGFLAVVVVMVVIFSLEFWYFKKKGWFD